MESTPGPWYSTMAPVPPFTVRMPATFKMTSLGDVQPERVPVSFTPITFEEEIAELIVMRKFRGGKKIYDDMGVTGNKGPRRHRICAKYCILLTLGHLSSQGIPAMTSTASAPPTPMQMEPSPPPFGVWESVPISITPG